MAYQSEIEKLQRRYEEKPEQWFAAYADAYRKAGELDVALEIVRSGIEERPNYVSGYIVLGRCLVDQGKDSDAQEAFEQVLALDAENIIALSNLGEVSERSGDVTGARRWLERLLEVDPMNDKARHSLERLAQVVPPPSEVAEEAPAADAAAPDEPGDQDGRAAEDESFGAAAVQEPEPAHAEPPALESPPDAEVEPPPPEVTPEPALADSFERNDRFAPAEPGPDLVSAEEELELDAEEDVSSVFGATPSSPESVSLEDTRDQSQFHIERHSDPFETPSEAKNAQSDAAALWATLGEDPELESVPDAESTAQDKSADTDFGVAEEPPEITKFSASSEPQEDEAESVRLEPTFDAPPPPVGGTTQMPAADLNALVEREREEARERDRAPRDDFPPDTVGHEATAAEDDEELIGGPPPEYQLESPEPRPASQSVPLFADSDLLATDSSDQDRTVSEEPASASAGPADEPELVMPSALESDSRMDVEADDVSSEPESQRPPYGEPEDTEDVVTETMAEVYAAQGLFAEAKEVYRKLLDRRPGDEDVLARLQAIEGREREAAKSEAEAADRAPAMAASREYAASRTGGVSARTFLAELLGEHPRGVPDESAPEPPTATTVLDETFASDRSDSQGQPTRPAVDEMSLASVFGDRAPDTGEHRRPSTEQVAPPPPQSPPPPVGQSPPDDLDLSFDSFFSSGSETTPAEPEDEGMERDDDDEDFKAWLKSLKS